MRFFLSLFLVASVANADWQVTASETIPAGSDRITHLQKRVTGGSRSARLDLVLFDVKTASLRVIDNPDGKSTLGEAMRKTNALAGVNGGYFHPDFTPLGLLVADDVRIHQLEKAKLLSGLMIVLRNRAALLRIAEFKPSIPMMQAVQAGPFLVDRSVPVAGLNATRTAVRTVLLSDRADRFALALCQSATLAEAAEILAQPGVITEMKVVRALNLDGGSSSGLWIRGAGEPFYFREVKTVRDFVAVTLRTK